MSRVGDRTRRRPKAPFSIATMLRYGERATHFPVLLHISLDTYLIMLSVKQGSIDYYFFWVFGMIWPVIKPWSPGPLVHTLSHKANGPVYIHMYIHFLLSLYVYMFYSLFLSPYIYIYIYIYIGNTHFNFSLSIYLSIYI